MVVSFAWGMCALFINLLFGHWTRRSDAHRPQSTGGEINVNANKRLLLIELATGLSGSASYRRRYEMQLTAVLRENEPAMSVQWEIA